MYTDNYLPFVAASFHKARKPIITKKYFIKLNELIITYDLCYVKDLQILLNLTVNLSRNSCFSRFNSARVARTAIYYAIIEQKLKREEHSFSIKQ